MGQGFQIRVRITNRRRTQGVFIQNTGSKKTKEKKLKLQTRLSFITFLKNKFLCEFTSAFLKTVRTTKKWVN